jgi:hypothetical protein
MHHPHMGARRILVANEFASYRQALALALRELRPHLEVFEAESESLDGEVARLRPDLVICSRATHTVRQRVANWVELYPECKPYSTFYISGRRRAKREVHLSDLLDLCASPPQRAP